MYKPFNTLAFAASIAFCTGAYADTFQITFTNENDGRATIHGKVKVVGYENPTTSSPSKDEERTFPMAGDNVELEWPRDRANPLQIKAHPSSSPTFDYCTFGELGDKVVAQDNLESIEVIWKKTDTVRTYTCEARATPEDGVTAYVRERTD